MPHLSPRVNKANWEAPVTSSSTIYRSLLLLAALLCTTKALPAQDWVRAQTGLGKEKPRERSRKRYALAVGAIGSPCR